MRILLAVLAMTAPVLAGGEKVQVACLSTVLADLAASIGGENVEVISVVKAGMDPHEFEPSPADVKALSRAAVIFASGMGLEGSYLQKLRDTLRGGPVFVVVGESLKPLPLKEGHEHETGRGESGDPHWWHSIANARIAARVIRDALTACDPAHKAAYEANARACFANLDDLARWAKVQVAALPRDRRILVTSHDSLAYLARDYGFTVLPIQGIKTGDQPSSQKVRELIAQVREAGVPVIFAENVENPKVVAEITRETGARLGGVLYTDGLGAAEAATYEAMMRHNLSTIVEGLKKGP